MDINRLNKLNEELKQILNEMDIDPSFQDYMKGRKAYQKGKDEKEAEYYKKNANLDDENDYGTIEYKRYLAKSLGKHEADEILKTIYNKCHIDLENGGIKEIPVPTNIREVKDQLKDDNTAMILKRGDFISLITNRYNTIASEWSNNKYGSSFTNIVSEPGWKGKEFDISKPLNLSKVINKGLFDQAWLVYGGSTQQLMQARRAAYIGSDEEQRIGADWRYDTDKSGYLKRNLKRELAAMTRDAKKQDFDRVKNSANELRKNFIKRIKDSDIEDISTKDLSAFVNRLKDIESTYFSDYTSDAIKKSQAEIEAQINNLNILVDRIFTGGKE